MTNDRFNEISTELRNALARRRKQGGGECTGDELDIIFRTLRKIASEQSEEDRFRFCERSKRFEVANSPFAKNQKILIDHTMNCSMPLTTLRSRHIAKAIVETIGAQDKLIDDFARLLEAVLNGFDTWNHPAAGGEEFDDIFRNLFNQANRLISGRKKSNGSAH